MKYKITVLVDHYPPDSFAKLEATIKDGFIQAGMDNAIKNIDVKAIKGSTNAVNVDNNEQ